jgi:putative tricarboxylic transport membrane protein
VRALPFAAIIAAAGYFYVLADRLEFDSAPGRIGPDAWPKAVLALMIAASIIGIVKAFARRKPDAGETALLDLTGSAEAMAEAAEDAGPSWLHLPILGVGLFVGYVLVIGFVGFVIATAVLIAAFLYLGRYRNHLVIALSSVAGSLGFFFVFRKIAYISLPLGKELFLSFSVALSRLMGIN